MENHGWYALLQITAMIAVAVFVHWRWPVKPYLIRGHAPVRPGKIIPPRGGSGVVRLRKNCKMCGGPTDDVCAFCGNGMPDPRRGVTPVVVMR